MSTFESQPNSSNTDGYLSDGSWCSDFDDSPEHSNFCNSPISENYSQEIKDNQINENLEAQLANVSYVNVQPAHIAPEVSSPAVSTTPSSTSYHKLPTKNLGAIPKTAFSYLNNDAGVSCLKNKISGLGNQRINRKSEGINKSSDAFSQPLNQSSRQRDENTLVTNSRSLDQPNKEALQDNLNSTKTTVSQKSPGKLKPEAFSFLSRVIENQSIKETTNKNYKEDIQHFVPTAFVDAGNLKPSHGSPIEATKCPSAEKQKWINTTATAPPLPNFPNNPIHIISSSITNATKFAKTFQGNDNETVKPPLPSRPPPIFKYPPGTFSQQLPGTSIKTKYVQNNTVLSSSSLPPSPIQTDPQLSCFPKWIDNNVRLENVHELSEDRKAIEKVTRPIMNATQQYLKSIVVFPKTDANDHFENIGISNEGTSSTKTSTLIDTPLSNLINPSILSRPLPPVPHSSELKIRNSVVNPDSARNETENIKTKTEIACLLIPTSQTENISRFTHDNPLTEPVNESAPASQMLNFEDQILRETPVPKLKPKPHQQRPLRLDIIGNQTHVSSHIFNSQQNISAAITARLQNKCSTKPADDSYENPNKETAPPPVFSEHENLTRSLGLSMEPTKPDIPLREENSTIVKESSHPRTFSVITTREQKFTANAEAIENNMSRFAWFHDLNAREAQLRLLALGEDGTFLIRHSSLPTNEIQYTTCVVYRRRVLNLHIRRKANGQYALGKEKNGEKTFSSLSDLIKYYQEVPIEIRPVSKLSSSQELIKVCLRVTPPK